MPPAAGAGPQRPGGKAVRLGVRVSESRMPGRGAARASSPLLKYFKLLSDRDCHGPVTVASLRHSVDGDSAVTVTETHWHVTVTIITSVNFKLNPHPVSSVTARWPHAARGRGGPGGAAAGPGQPESEAEAPASRPPPATMKWQ